MTRMNYFIEGIQGAGKSTLVRYLSEQWKDFQVFHEGDYSPVELAWCAYLTEKQFGEMLKKYPSLEGEISAETVEEDGKRIVCYTRVITDIMGFHKDLEQFEIYNGRVDRQTFEEIILSRYAKWSGEGQIFECSLFQNIMESQMLYYEMSDDEVLDFYVRVKQSLGGQNYQILYLDAENVAENLQIIRKERVDEKGNEMWFPLMMRYVEESPYGARHGLKGFEGLLAHLERRRNLELRLLREVFAEHAVILKSKAYELKDILMEKGMSDIYESF